MSAARIGAAVSTGEAIRTRYDALIQAADLKVGAVAWEVRSRVRVRLVDVYSNGAEIDLLQRAVDRVNADLSVIERIRRFIVADEAFSIENEQLTPSMKTLVWLAESAPALISLRVR